MRNLTRRTILALLLIPSCMFAGLVFASQPKLEWRALDEGSADKACSAVSFEKPRAIAIDRTGNIYITNEKGVNAVQRISPDGGIVTVLDRRSKGLKDGQYFGLSLAIDNTNRVILGVGGRGTIERLGADGILTVLAGQPGKIGIVNGLAHDARFKAIAAVAAGIHDEIYIADSRTVRKLNAEGVVSTLAGNEHAKLDYSDGQGAAAAFGTPKGIVVEKSGNIIVADGSWRVDEGRTTSFGLMREIDSTGVVKSIAGSIDADGGHLDGTGTDSFFTELFGIAIDGEGNLFVTEDHPPSLRLVLPTLVVTTIVLTEELANDQKDRDGLHPAWHEPRGVAADSQGYFYVVDTGASKLHRVNINAFVTTLSTCN